MEPRIRPSVPGDQPFLWVALYHALHVPPGSEPLPPGIVRQPEIARYAEDWLERPGDAGFIAEVGGEPVGAVWLRRWRDGERGFGFVEPGTPELSMSLVPAYRGRGIGTALLRCVLAQAARQSEAVSLSVSLSNPALRLYERAGFRAVGEPEGGSVTMLRRSPARAGPEKPPR